MSRAVRVPGGVHAVEAAPTGCAWRIAPCGTAEVYVVRLINEATASVCSRVGKGWAKKPMTIARADLFATRSEARAESRRRPSTRRIRGRSF